MQATNANVILTRDEVAGWLKVRPRQVERLGVPCIDLGRKTKRYFANDVLAWLEAKRVEAGAASVEKGPSADSSHGISPGMGSRQPRTALDARSGGMEGSAWGD